MPLLFQYWLINDFHETTGLFHGVVRPEWSFELLLRTKRGYFRLEV